MNTGLVNTHITTAKRNNLCIVFIFIKTMERIKLLSGS